MKILLSIMLGAFLLWAKPVSLLAHCDTMDGPVVKAAKEALNENDVNLALIWIKPDSEAEVKAAFEKSMTARKQGKEAQELADQYFFETVVRLHRAGEGETYDGIKPAGTHVCEVIPVADKALDIGSEEDLMKMIQEKVKQGVTDLYRNVQEKNKNAKTSVEAGREYVEAYVTFMHYVESVFETANLGCEKHAGKFEMLLNEK
jgi:hypothetical protein